IGVVAGDTGPEGLGWLRLEGHPNAHLHAGSRSSNRICRSSCAPAIDRMSRPVDRRARRSASPIEYPWVTAPRGDQLPEQHGNDIMGIA
ncbi:hypothetical protein, partial [Serratia marcescens]|uniref:hypothetical protein n=1 Tax=Serratia marcescens TaxID=615 RepID=UPI001954948D